MVADVLSVGIVDDQPLFVDGVRDALRSKTTRLVAASSTGDSLLDWLEGHNLDIVLVEPWQEAWPNELAKTKDRSDESMTTKPYTGQRFPRQDKRRALPRSRLVLFH